KGIDALVVLLEKLDAEQKDLSFRLERLKAETAHQQPTALAETQTLIDLLNKADGAERKGLRVKVKARIKQLVSEMWMMIWDATPTIRAAEVQIELHSGKVLAFQLSWLRRGRWRGLVTGVGHPVALPDHDRHMADKR